MQALEKVISQNIVDGLNAFSSINWCNKIRVTLAQVMIESELLIFGARFLSIESVH